MIQLLGILTLQSSIQWPKKICAKTSTEFRRLLFRSGFEGQSWWTSASMPSLFFPIIYHAMPIFGLLDLHDMCRRLDMYHVFPFDGKELSLWEIYDHMSVSVQLHPGSSLLDLNLGVYFVFLQCQLVLPRLVWVLKLIFIVGKLLKAVCRLVAYAYAS